MHSSRKGQQLAQFVRDNTLHWNGPNSASKHFESLSSKMCWDAVIYCLEHCDAKPSHIKEPIIADDYTTFVPDPQTNKFSRLIKTRDEMEKCRQGSLLAFINTSDGNKLIHAMISVGLGFAAGNKNACIGIGRPGGWEMLYLAGKQGDETKLDWDIAGASFMQGGRKIKILEFQIQD